jgi:RNA polymerase sigma factor (sigma-70 family)
MEPTSTIAPRVAMAAGEVETVERARRGDAVAFERLIAPRIDGLFRTAWAIVGREADARDVTQEACLSAWRRLPSLRQPDRFDAWLGRILVNACRMHLRRRSRVREVAIGATEEVRPSPTDEQAQVAETELINAAFEQLRPDERALLVLHHLQHQPVATIAASLGIPTGTVKWRLHAAREALQAALDGERR